MIKEQRFDHCAELLRDDPDFRGCVDILDNLSIRSPLPDNDTERKAIPIYDGFIKYFPHAIVEVAKVSVAGNNQHNPGEPVHHDPDKSPDELNSLCRHLIEGAVEDSITLKAKKAWRAMMDLEKAAKKQLEKGWEA